MEKIGKLSGTDVINFPDQRINGVLIGERSALSLPTVEKPENARNIAALPEFKGFRIKEVPQIEAFWLRTVTSASLDNRQSPSRQYGLSKTSTEFATNNLALSTRVNEVGSNSVWMELVFLFMPSVLAGFY